MKNLRRIVEETDTRLGLAFDLSIQALKIATERDGQQHENYIGAMKLRGFMLELISHLLPQT